MKIFKSCGFLSFVEEENMLKDQNFWQLNKNAPLLLYYILKSPPKRSI